MDDRAQSVTPASWTVGIGDPPDTLRLVGGLAFGGNAPSWPAARLCAAVAGEASAAWMAVGGPVQELHWHGRCVGATWEDAHARHCVLWGITAAPGEDPAAQTAAAFAALEGLLADAGFALGDVIRTWCFLDDILAWYDEFNAVRNALFRERGLFGGLVPASTGIGCANADQSAVSLSAWARVARCDAACAQAVPSPLQCPAIDYRSAFSRAVRLPAGAGGDFLTVSGTASIGADGSTVHVGDFDAQVAHTLDVVDAILCAEGCAWAEVVRPIAYLRHASDLPRWRRLRAKDARVAELRWVEVEATICRDDLLFEIECDALTADR